MSEPQTLLALSGADLTPSRLSAAAVVLIDCQMEYVNGALALPGVGPALEAAGRLLSRAREAGTPVVHIVHKGQPGGPFDLEAERGQIAPQVAAENGETVISKGLPNGFAGTDLHATLQALGRKELIFGGFMTHMCVSSSVRAALDLGYRATLVAGAAATRDLPLPGGGVIDAKSLHNASLAALADRFAIIVPDADALPE